MNNKEFERYVVYKDSGVEWLGDVPECWEITRNKDIFEERGDLSLSGDETLLTVSHITGVTRRSEKNVNMFMAETMEGHKLCKTGDFIINTMWAWMGALGTANESGICSPAYGVYKPKKYAPYNHRFFDYLYRTPNAITEMTRNSKGIVSSRLRLYPKDFFQIKTALPVEIEQQAIADYLDTKTAQIDKKIELLAQKATLYGKLKQSLINETVTRGLDKTVPMKDSGVEWIGEIPVHWEVFTMKQVFTYIVDNRGKTPPIEDSGIPMLEIRHLRSNSKHPLSDYDKFISQEIYDNFLRNYLETGDILFGTVGSIGQTAIVPKDFNYCIAQNIVGFRAIKKCSPDFYYYFLTSIFFLKCMSLANKQSIQESIKVSNLIRNFIPVPPLKEQQAIATYLDEKTAHLDRIIENINAQVGKLKELRKALINDVVTGKIKVCQTDNMRLYHEHNPNICHRFQ